MSQELEKAIEASIKRTGEALRKACQLDGKPFGFALFMFGFGDDEAFSYVSNAERSSMVRKLRELAERLEAAN